MKRDDSPPARERDDAGEDEALFDAEALFAGKDDDDDDVGSLRPLALTVLEIVPSIISANMLTSVPARSREQKRSVIDSCARESRRYAGTRCAWAGLLALL